MKLKDYVSYMQLQHDEDPLYIFDDEVFCIHNLISFATPVEKTHLTNRCSLENQRQHYWKITVSLIYSKKIFLTFWIMINVQHSDGLLLDQKDQVLLGMLIQDWQVHGIPFFVAEKGLSVLFLTILNVTCIISDFWYL